MSDLNSQFSKELLRKGVSNHKVYIHVKDGSMWQFSYLNRFKTFSDKVNSFKGTYSDIIPKYGMSPNLMKKLNLFQEKKYSEILFSI